MLKKCWISFPLLVLILFIIGLNSIMIVSGFNLSPKPNIVFKEPELKIYKPKDRASYFGFTVNLREESVIIGAPRAQSSLESQRHLNETGAIYKCSLQSGECAPYVFDSLGNVNVEAFYSTYDSEIKNYQWLGASIDGGPKETDRMVVCASRLVGNVGTEYLAHGICYWTPNTLGSEPKDVRKIIPLRAKDQQIKLINRNRAYYYAFGQMGMSAHITKNQEEILIGAPGIHTWKGSVIRYRPTVFEDFGGLSRRSYNDSQHKIVTRETIEYTSDIPDPGIWGQQNDSYFGYAVSSGQFDSREPHKIYYVASAPQADFQSGEVYLFTYSLNSIEIHRKFSGKQFGEYFGYALLCDDFNGDDLPDLAVSAPLYSIGGSNYENGAVYIYLNKGELNFELSNVLKSGNNSPGRFGISLSKLGDINHDGFNDIGIGAPFDGNGAIYIFLGGSNGFIETPSQIIVSPIDNPLNQSMFGHGISNGVDIDFNGHHDLAVGAPNSEIVYVYRTYPVIRVDAYTQSFARSININQTKFQFRACWALESTSNQTNQQPIKITLKVDPQVKRAFFTENINEMEFEAIAVPLPTCKIYDVQVKFSLPDIFKPIDIEIHHEVMRKIPDSEVFCDTCAAVSPRDPKFSSEKITFTTGCKSLICISDLKVTSSGFGKSYILGSSRTLIVTYSVKNSGETSYLTELNITAPAQVPFAKIPPSCTLHDKSLRCTLYKGRPLLNGIEDTLVITFDTTKLTGESFTVRAEAFNTGSELNPADNAIVDIVQIREFSEIDITYRQLTPVLNLENDLGMREIKNLVEIRNKGPSKIKHMKIIIYIPISYLVPTTQSRILLVEYNNITITATHNKKTTNAVFTQNNTIIIQNAIESSSTPVQPAESMQGMGFDSSKVGYPIEYDPDSQPDSAETELGHSMSATRRRRDISDEYIANIEYDRLTKWDNTLVAIKESLMSLVPLNKTVLFNCHNPADALCIEASLDITNFVPGDDIVSISISYNIDLDQVDKLMVEPIEYFVATTLIDVVKIEDEEGKTIQVHKTYPHNIISKYKLAIIPLWVYIVSALVGLLILVMMTYGFYKMGFFKREKKEELEKLHRRSQREEEAESEQRLT